MLDALEHPSPAAALLPEPDTNWRDALDVAARTAFARGGLAAAYAAVNAAISTGALRATPGALRATPGAA